MTMIDLDASSRLLQTIERLSNASAATEGALAPESRGPVPKEMADAFRTMMEEGVQAPSGDSLDTFVPEAVRTSFADPEVRVAESSVSTESMQSTRGPSDVEAPVENPPPSPVELYQLQFSVNLHLMDVKALSAVRDHVTTDLESALRSAQ